MLHAELIPLILLERESSSSSCEIKQQGFIRPETLQLNICALNTYTSCFTILAGVLTYVGMCLLGRTIFCCVQFH